MSERKLASIQIIADIQPIEGADMIEVATVKGWKLVTKKNEFKIGDKAIYFEIDSFLPTREEFEFLRKTSFKKMGDLEGFRLKTIKLRGQVSQGLLTPMHMLQDKMGDGQFDALQVGDDVTEILGVLKYEPPIPAQLAGVMKGLFPGFMPKTDEERIQNLAEFYEGYKKHMCYVTEKLDGSSTTYYYNNGEFGVCSRNLDLLETPDNTLWKVAREQDIENKMRPLGNFALQGELIGEGIQGNPYKLRGQSCRFFNVYDLDRKAYLGFAEFKAFVKSLGLVTVPILDEAFTLPDTMDALLKHAEGKSSLNPGAEREGIVIRSHDRGISFKVISNRFLLKES